MHTAYWENLNNTELWGFLPGQVRQFLYATDHGSKLYAWHVLPLGVYRENEKALLAASADLAQGSEDIILEILKNDPNARLVIKFHGNAGHVAQGWRPDTYRTLTGAAPDSIHVVGFDYRGFGYSTGSPTEEGLIQDGIQMLYWALKVANIPPQRIVLFGQSLGTAVATAVTEHFTLKQNIQFAGLVLVAPFVSIPELLPEYTIAGCIPTLSPLKMHPLILKWVLSRVVDTWTTSDRLANLVQKSNTFNIALIHARNDAEIPWTQSQCLFKASTNTTIGTKMREEIAGGGWVETWTEGAKRIKLIISPSGGMLVLLDLRVSDNLAGHNQIMTYPVAAKAVLDCFDGVKQT